MFRQLCHGDLDAVYSIGCVYHGHMPTHCLPRSKIARVPFSFVAVIDLGLISTCSAIHHLHAPYAGVTNFSEGSSEGRKGIICTPGPVLCESKPQRIHGSISL